ncbi:cytochrome C [Aquabacterium humicola]|uniref:cytochrome C n=1 Tax=Aquabacterium humicola TaxID=3237377 RepID=UPI00254363FF|nr:cytochrome C [Rubrivivax pictus]
MKTIRLLLLPPLLAAAFAVRADGPALPAAVPPAYRQECAACHTLYAPRMLPAASWHRIMTGLGRHYGTDASLDADTVKQLDAWLQAHAMAGGWRTWVKAGPEAPPEDRITRSAWFERKHRRIDATVWNHAAVRSAANCAACHPRADEGDYDEHGLRFPAGLDARQRRAWRD